LQTGQLIRPITAGSSRLYLTTAGMHAIAATVNYMQGVVLHRCLALWATLCLDRLLGWVLSRQVVVITRSVITVCWWQIVDLLYPTI